MIYKKAASFTKSLMVFTALSCMATPGHSLTKAQFEALSNVSPADLTALEAATGAITTQNFVTDITTAKALIGSSAQSISADITAIKALIDTPANFATALTAFRGTHANWLANMALTTATSSTTILQYLTDLRTALWNTWAHSSNATDAGTNLVVPKIAGGASTVTNMTFADWMNNANAKGLIA